MSIEIHVSSTAGRVNPSACLESYFGGSLPRLASRDVGDSGGGKLGVHGAEHGINATSSTDIAEKQAADGGCDDSDARGWVYSSGPPGLLEATEAACIAFQRTRTGRRDREGVKALEWYCARWEV